MLWYGRSMFPWLALSWTSTIADWWTFLSCLISVHEGLILVLTVCLSWKAWSEHTHYNLSGRTFRLMLSVALQDSIKVIIWENFEKSISVSNIPSGVPGFRQVKNMFSDYYCSSVERAVKYNYWNRVWHLFGWTAFYVIMTSLGRLNF